MASLSRLEALFFMEHQVRLEIVHSKIKSTPNMAKRNHYIVITWGPLIVTQQ